MEKQLKKKYIFPSLAENRPWAGTRFFEMKAEEHEGDYSSDPACTCGIPGRHQSHRGCVRSLPPSAVRQNVLNRSINLLCPPR